MNFTDLGFSEVKDLLYVMLKGDEGIFLRQLTDLISRQNLANAIRLYGVEDSGELRLYFEFLSAGISAFIVKWISEDSLPQDKAEELLSDILIQLSAKLPENIR